MKKLSKFLTIAIMPVLVTLALANNAKAQQTTPPPPPMHTSGGTATSSPINFSIGFEAGLPTGLATNSSNVELGGTGQFQFNVAPSVGITLTSGFYDLLGKKRPDGSSYNGFQLVPVQAGAKFFLAPQFYLGAEAGAGFVTTTGGHTKLLLAPGLGWANQHWDFGLRYESITGQDYNYGFVGLRLAYSIPL